VNRLPALTLITVVVLAPLPGHVWGQDLAPPASPAAPPSVSYFFEHTFTFRLTEARFVSDSAAPPVGYATWEGGFLRRFGSNALGASACLCGDADGSRLGLHSRYRRWLGGKTILDLSLGATFPGSTAFVLHRSPAFSGAVTVAHGNWLGFRVQVEALRSARVNVWSYDPGQGEWVADHQGFENDVGVYAGARFSGAPAWILSAAEVVLGIIAVAAVGWGR